MAKPPLSEEERKARNNERSRKWRAANKTKRQDYEREYQKKWYQKNKESVKAKQKKYCEENPDKREDTRLRARYGITLAQRDAMLAAQGFRCGLCPTDDPGPKGQWHVDHCHDTGKVRALLCMQCNVGIGNLQHSPALLRAAADYIEKHANDTR